MKNQKVFFATLLVLCLSMTMIFSQIPCIKADEDPSLRIIVDGSNKVSGSSWFAGYVITPSFDGNTLLISAQGPDHLFPVSNINILVLFSDNAKNNVETLTIDNKDIITSGSVSSIYSYSADNAIPEPYNNNGVFNAPDYGCYIPVPFKDLTYSESGLNVLQVPIRLVWDDAPSDAKVMILIAGIDKAGKPAFSPISEGTLFNLPEYALGGLLALSASFAAFIIFKRRPSQNVLF